MIVVERRKVKRPGGKRQLRLNPRARKPIGRLKSGPDAQGFTSPRPTVSQHRPGAGIGPASFGKEALRFRRAKSPDMAAPSVAVR